MSDARRRAWKLAGAIALASFVSTTIATPAHATRGVAVDLQRVTIGKALSPGQSVTLPAVTLRNPGDEAAVYLVSAGGIDRDGFLEPLDAWFALEPRELRLDAAASQKVAVTLHLPRDATPGTYAGLLRFELLAEGTGSLVRAAAGIQLTFQVVEAARPAVGEAMAASLPWITLVVGSLLVAAAALWARRHLRIRIERH